MVAVAAARGRLSDNNLAVASQGHMNPVTWQKFTPCDPNRKCESDGGEDFTSHTIHQLIFF